MRRKHHVRDCAALPDSFNLNEMGKRGPARVAVTFRVSPEAAEKLRSFLADYAGKPLFLKPGSFAEKALLREIERLELVLAGALPPDSASGEISDPITERKTILNRQHLNHAPHPVGPSGCTGRS